jgi:hypothetical protein
MNDKSGKRFFITHSHTDNIFAERFAGDLKRLGLDGFFDIYSIRPGDNIPDNINKGLAECDIYVQILSKVALDSPWCKEEISAALMLSNTRDRLGRPRIIPVLIEECQFQISQEYPILLTRYYVSFVDRYDDALQELIEKGFDRPLDGKIPETTILAQFIQIPLDESGLANENLSVYKNPPFGDCRWYGIPFCVHNARISMANIFASESKLLNSFEPVFGVCAVHFLINAGDGRKKYNREIGHINFIFEQDETPQLSYPVTLGKNVREWAIGNWVSVSETNRVADALVRTVEDKNSRQVWKGETRDGDVAVIDMLTVKIDASKHTKQLSGIQFTRSVPPNTIALDYFVSGVTIEIGTLK